jgi:hypothetical protein
VNLKGRNIVNTGGDFETNTRRPELSISKKSAFDAHCNEIVAFFDSPGVR